MMTYENASEIPVLKALWRPDAPLENTVFAILDPNGRSIVRGGRSPDFAFRDAADMANSMNQIARYYNATGATPQALPAVDTVRLALDVAACDKRPLAIVVGRTEQERQLLANALAPVAWSKDLIGKLVYTAGSGSELRQVRGASIDRGYIFVAPNLFGTEGMTMQQVADSASPADQERAAKQAVSWFHPEYVEHQDHVRMGRQAGIEWQTATPVTDPHAPNSHQGEFGRGGRPPFGGPPGYGMQ